MYKGADHRGKYWSYAAEIFVYIKKYLLQSVPGKSLYETLTKKLPKPHHVRVFECAAFIYSTSSPSKFHSKAAFGVRLIVRDHCVYIV